MALHVGFWRWFRTR